MKFFFNRHRRATWNFPSERGLFVIGAARSGTTILQDALNHSRDICLLGEPDLHTESEEGGFAARFNAMHHSWNNQQTKGTYLPVLGDSDGSWRAHLEDLSKVYRLVGTKVVASPGQGDAWMERLRAFHNRYFFTSRYIFTFRAPTAVLKSTMLMRGLASGDITSLAQNYAAVIVLFTQMARTMPNVRAVVHEDIDASTFEKLGEWLGVSLEGAHAYYQSEKVVSHTADGFEGEAFDKRLELLNSLYQNLRRLVADGAERPQIQQNGVKLYAGQKAEIYGLLDSQAGYLAKN